MIWQIFPCKVLADSHHFRFRSSNFRIQKLSNCCKVFSMIGQFSRIFWISFLARFGYSAHFCGPRIARSMVTTQKFHQQVEARHFAFCGLSGTEHFLATLQAKKVLQVLESSERGNNRTICNLSRDHLVSFCTIVRRYNEMSTFYRSFNQSKYYIEAVKYCCYWLKDL